MFLYHLKSKETKYLQERNLYKPIKDFLLSHNQSEIELSFEKIETILGFELPVSAKKNLVWWNWSPESNTHPHAKNWNTIGWTAKKKRDSVLFSNNNFISDSELKNLELSISEFEFYKNYPRKYVSKIDLSVKDWIALIEDKTFTDENISFLKRIYLSPNHASTCYSISVLEESSPYSYNSPIIALSKRIIDKKQLKQLYGSDGNKTYWRYLFWGRDVDNHSHFEWLLRPELLIAFRKVYPELQNQKAEEYLDFQMKEELSISPIPEHLEEEPITPKVKLDTVSINSHEGYPRSKNVAYTALVRCKYNCELDSSHQSFINKATGKKYLETHHLIPLAYYEEFDISLDHIANVVCLCSECHNKLHYGINTRPLIEKLYNERKEQLYKAGISISLERLFEMYNS